MAGLSGNWLKEGAADAGAVGLGETVVMPDYPGCAGWAGACLQHRPSQKAPSRASSGLAVPPAATFSTWVWTMVVLTLLWPSSACTVRMSVPACSKWVANEWRRVCTETGVTMPAVDTAFFKARCCRSSNKWWRRSTPLRGSTENVGEGNNQNQAHE